MFRFIFVLILGLCCSLSSLAAGEGHGVPQPKMDKSKATRPGLVKLNAPAALAKVSAERVNLEWEASADATSYHVQLATDPNFKWLVRNETFHQGLNLELSGLEPGSFYYWRVAGVKGDNDAGWTQGTFTASSFETAK